MTKSRVALQWWPSELDPQAHSSAVNAGFTTCGGITNLIPRRLDRAMQSFLQYLARS